MDTKTSGPSFSELVRIADCLLDESGDEDDELMRRLETLPPEVRNELFVSDLLNAWQVFYYFYRTEPDDLVHERLDLEPASALPEGVKIDEIELLERVFRVTRGIPEILVTDGKETLKAFSGTSALADSLAYIESTL